MLSIKIKRNVMFYLVAVLIAFMLKQYYSRASAENLVWILKPTASLVSFISGDTFLFETGTGYVCNSQRIIIAPACAGVNFMLMAFGMSVFTGMHHMRSIRQRFLWMICCLTASYGLTVIVNTLRIVVSVHTFHADIFSSGLTWSWVHRLEGVVIYFFFQYLFYSMISRIIKQYKGNKSCRKTVPCIVDSNRNAEIRKIVFTGLTPCTWYLAVTLAVPFLNKASQKTGGQFYNHAAIVLILCLMTWICIVAVTLCGRSIRLLFTGGYRKHETPNPDC